jgi:hypothetical protein
MQYQTLRSVSDSHIFVICYDGRFNEVPDHVRHQGPWQGMHRGEIEKLKANYRRARSRRLCAREVRPRGVQARGLNPPSRRRAPY